MQISGMTADMQEHLEFIIHNWHHESMYGNQYNAAYFRYMANKMRNEGPYADVENGPSPDDCDQVWADDLEERADQIECNMERGEYI